MKHATENLIGGILTLCVCAAFVAAIWYGSLCAHRLMHKQQGRPLPVNYYHPKDSGRVGLPHPEPGQVVEIRLNGVMLKRVYPNQRKHSYFVLVDPGSILDADISDKGIHFTNTFWDMPQPYTERTVE